MEPGVSVPEPELPAQPPWFLRAVWPDPSLPPHQARLAWTPLPNPTLQVPGKQITQPGEKPSLEPAESGDTGPCKDAGQKLPWPGQPEHRQRPGNEETGGHAGHREGLPIPPSKDKAPAMLRRSPTGLHAEDLEGTSCWITRVREAPLQVPSVPLSLSSALNLPLREPSRALPPLCCHQQSSTSGRRPGTPPAHGFLSLRSCSAFHTI